MSRDKDKVMMIRKRWGQRYFTNLIVKNKAVCVYCGHSNNVYRHGFVQTSRERKRVQRWYCEYCDRDFTLADDKFFRNKNSKRVRVGAPIQRE